MEKPVPIDLQIALAHAARGNFLNVIDFYSRLGRKEDAGVFLRRNHRYSSAARMFYEAALAKEERAGQHAAAGRRGEAERLHRQARRLKLKAISLVFHVAELGEIRDARFYWERVGERELIGRLAEKVYAAARAKFARGRLTSEEATDALYLAEANGRGQMVRDLRRLRRLVLQEENRS